MSTQELEKFQEVKQGGKGSGRVYLVYTDVHSLHGLPYHPGLASIGAVLLKYGHEVKLGYMTSETEYEKIVQDVLNFEPEVIGFTTVETQLIYVQRLAARIKARYECLTVVGGTHITLWPQALTEPRSESFDCGMCGDAEMSFLELVQKAQRGQDYHGIDNLCYRHPDTGEVVTNRVVSSFDKMEDLPHPATEIFEFQEMITKNNTALFHFSRGCPYPCTFCSARELLLKQGPVKEGLKKRSVESTIEEIELTLSQYDVPSSTLMMFTDDLFTLDKEWVYGFMSLYEKRIRRPFWCTTRANLVTSELFDRLKSAGCDQVMMSIESGNDYIRNVVMKRNMSRKHLHDAFSLAYKYGIKTCGSCIIGLPFETAGMIEDSMDLVAQLNVTNKGIGIFYPYRGTALRPVCEENGFMPKEEISLLSNDPTGDFVERKKSILNLPTITKDEILYYHDNWEKLIYSRQGLRQRLAYNIKSTMQTVAQTKPGAKLKASLEHIAGGAAIKRGVVDLLSRI